MELPRPLWLLLGLVLVVNSAPVHYITLPASTYPLPPQGNPFYYLSSPLSRTAANPQGSETSFKYAALSHPEATANQRYVIAPYSSYQGFLPFGRTQVAGLGPQGYLNSEYLVYPSVTDAATGRQGIFTNLIGLVQQQLQNLQLPSFLRPRPEKPESPEIPDRPEAPERPSEGNAPLPPFSEGVSGPNPAPEETEDLDTVNPDENPAAPASNAESEESAAKPEENPAKPEETPVKPEEAAEEKPESPMEEMNAEMASESRLFARSRAYPGREGEGD